MLSTIPYVPMRTPPNTPPKTYPSEYRSSTPICEGTMRLRSLIVEYEEQNVDRSIFIPQYSFLRAFTRPILDGVLNEIHMRMRAPNDITQHMRNCIYNKLRLTLAILVQIAREDLIFKLAEEDVQVLNDARLPFEKSALQQRLDPGGEQGIADKFYRKQYLFVPVTFDEGLRGSHIPSEQVLPILTMEKLSNGQGGFSTVSKITIHPDYDGLSYHRGENEPEHTYACKELSLLRDDAESDKMFRDEFQAQSIFQEMEVSGHILHLLACYKHNGKYRMIFPLADENLQQYMKRDQGPRDMEERYETLKQAAGLITALKAIHNRDGVESNSKIGSHRDLTIQNILIKQGSWVISDFGLARVRSLAPGEDSGIEYHYGASTYKAPECRVKERVGRASDIWSLACILSEVITFIVRGREGWEEFIKRRQTAKIAPAGVQLPPGLQDSFHDNFSLKTEVLEWFMELESTPEADAQVQDFLQLFTDMLQQKPDDRPRIDEVEDRFLEILDTYGDYEGHQALIRPTERPMPRTSRDQRDVLSRLNVPFRDDWVRSPIIPSPSEFNTPHTTTISSLVPGSTQPRRTMSLSQITDDGTSTMQENSSIRRGSITYSADDDGTGTMQENDSIRRGSTYSDVSSIFSTNATSGSRTGDTTPTSSGGMFQIHASGEWSYPEIPVIPVENSHEGPLSLLKGYDTVFLIHDSSTSMDTWYELGQLLFQLAWIASKLDPDGIDVRFVGSDHCDVQQVKTWELVAQAFGSVEPHQDPQPLLLCHKLSDILEKYRRASEQSGCGHKTRLNLIVLTSGELNEYDDIKGIIKEQIQKLDKIDATMNSIGVQFVLINGTKEVPSIFTYLDDRIHMDLGSTRDIVDVTSWGPEKGNDKKLYFKILCGAINKDLDNMETRARRTSWWTNIWRIPTFKA